MVGWRLGTAEVHPVRFVEEQQACSVGGSITFSPDTPDAVWQAVLDAFNDREAQFVVLNTRPTQAPSNFADTTPLAAGLAVQQSGDWTFDLWSQGWRFLDPKGHGSLFESDYSHSSSGTIKSAIATAFASRSSVPRA